MCLQQQSEPSITNSNHPAPARDSAPSDAGGHGRCPDTARRARAVDRIRCPAGSPADKSGGKACFGILRVACGMWLVTCDVQRVTCHVTRVTTDV
jgi:hypothetical protein